MVLGLMAGPVATAEANTKTTRVERTEEGGYPALAKLVASDGMASDRFGISVAVSGESGDASCHRGRAAMR
jgi:hypothetical protein